MHGLGAGEVGKKFGYISIITGPIGLLLGGFIADHLTKKGRKDAHMLALMVAPLGYGLPAIFFPLAGDVDLVWILLGISNLFINLPSGVAYAGLQIITPNQMRGQIIALYVLATNIIGYGCGPLLIGWTMDNIFVGDPAKSIALVGLITTPLSIGFYIWGRRAYAKAHEEEELRLENLANNHA